MPPVFPADLGTNLIKQGENVKGRPCGSVAQLAECSHGKREALGSSPGRATIFPPLLHLVAQCGFAARATSIKKCMSRCSSVVPSRFGDKSNSAGGNVRGRPNGSVAQLAESSHGKREALCSSPGRATIFSSPVTSRYRCIISRTGGQTMLQLFYITLISVDLAQYELLHGPSMFAVMAKIYGVLLNQSSSIAFDETSSYWPALKNS